MACQKARFNGAGRFLHISDEVIGSPYYRKVGHFFLQVWQYNKKIRKRLHSTGLRERVVGQ
jgi:hypothetical protein